jgi:DNA polymerase-3 subunit epsilon
LVIHNASFDMKFINAELSYLNEPALPHEQVIDTLFLARQKHPMGPNSLDALCKRYGIDNSKREKHGALLDASLLAEVYIELIGGRQTRLVLSSPQAISRVTGTTARVSVRQDQLPSRLTEAEREAHAALVRELGADALWLKMEH